MVFQVLADVAMVTHFAFIAFLVMGGILAWRWPRLILWHLAAVVWALINSVGGVECPLTYAEDWARIQAGLAGLGPDGFIAHYLTGVVYPEDQLPMMRAGVVAAVLIGWIGYAWTQHRQDTMSVFR